LAVLLWNPNVSVSERNFAARQTGGKEMTANYMFIAIATYAASTGICLGQTKAAAQPSATQNVNVVNTPSVSVTTMPSLTIGTLPAVSLAGTPAVTLSGSPTVNVGTLPAVNIGNQPTVLIGNTSSSPITVQQPTEDIFRLSFDVPFVIGGTGAGATSAHTVPAGKRLIIDNVSPFCQFGEANNTAYFEIFTTSNATRWAYFPTVATPAANGTQTTVMESTAVRILFDQGTTWSVSAHRSVGGTAATCQVKVLGREVAIQ
jgi:hypothetical protein